MLEDTNSFDGAQMTEALVVSVSFSKSLRHWSTWDYSLSAHGTKNLSSKVCDQVTLEPVGSASETS